MLTGAPLVHGRAAFEQRPTCSRWMRSDGWAKLYAPCFRPIPRSAGLHDANQVIAAFADAAGCEVPAETSAHRESYLKAAPLVGRKPELALLTTALDDALRGRGSAWLVGGESGVGKSRLLDEVRSRALVRGMVALTGRAEENQAPYSIFRNSPLRLGSRWLTSVTKKPAPSRSSFRKSSGCWDARFLRTVIDPQLFQ